MQLSSDGRHIPLCIQYPCTYEGDWADYSNPRSWICACCTCYTFNGRDLSLWKELTNRLTWGLRLSWSHDYRSNHGLLLVLEIYQLWDLLCAFALFAGILKSRTSRFHEVKLLHKLYTIQWCKCISVLVSHALCWFMSVLKSILDSLYIVPHGISKYCLWNKEYYLRSIPLVQFDFLIEEILAFHWNIMQFLENIM